MEVVTDNKERLQRKDYVPRLSYGRRMLRDDGGPNRYFLMYLHLRYQVGPFHTDQLKVRVLSYFCFNNLIPPVIPIPSIQLPPILL